MKIVQLYYSNLIRDSGKQLVEANINQKEQCKPETSILINWLTQDYKELTGCLCYHPKKNAGRTRHAGHYLPIVEIKDYNVMIGGQNFFNH